MLRELFKKNGYRVLVLSDPERRPHRFHRDPQAADVVLFSTGNNGRAALDAFNRFATESTTKELPTYFYSIRIITIGPTTHQGRASHRH